MILIDLFPNTFMRNEIKDMQCAEKFTRVKALEVAHKLKIPINEFRADWAGVNS